MVRWFDIFVIDILRFVSVGAHLVPVRVDIRFKSGNRETCTIS